MSSVNPAVWIINVMVKKLLFQLMSDHTRRAVCSLSHASIFPDHRYRRSQLSLTPLPIMSGGHFYWSRLRLSLNANWEKKIHEDAQQIMIGISLPQLLLWWSGSTGGIIGGEDYIEILIHCALWVVWPAMHWIWSNSSPIKNSPCMLIEVDEVTKNL